MKQKLLSLMGIALVLVMTVPTAFAQDKEEKKNPEFANLTVEQLQAAIKDGKVTVVDVNGLNSYNKGHIPGALHFRTLKKKGLKAALPKDKAALVVAYCGGPQ